MIVSDFFSNYFKILTKKKFLILKYIFKLNKIKIKYYDISLDIVKIL